MIHNPVLLEECVNFLVTDINGDYFDATLGFGGHSGKILERLSEKARLVTTDKDENALNFCKERFEGDSRVRFYKTSYKNIDSISKIEFIDKFDGIFADLGVSSFQLDDTASGFTYREDTVLDLRMDKSQGIPAYEILNSFEETELANIIFEFGEEKKSRQIARKIIEKRKNKTIKTTFQLRDIVEEIVPGFYSTRSLSRVFQALRIFVNDEITELKIFLEKSVDLLKPGGRIVILTYHSLEDREVKEIFRKETTNCICPPRLPVCICNNKAKIKILTKKPIVPSEEEIKLNSRSRSAKLRVAEKI